MRAVNLIPAAQRGSGGSAVGESQGAAYAILGVLAGLAVLAFLYGSARHQISSRRTQAATLTAQAQQAQAKATALAPYVSFAALREQRTQAVSQLVDSRFDWSHAFHELGRVLPPGVSLSSLDGTIGSAVAAAGAPASASATTAAAGATGSATPPGSVPTFTISGCATSQAEVALMLTRLRLIDGVGDVKLQSSTKGSSGSRGGGGGAGSSGSCATSAPVFTVQVAFQPLPSVQATSAAAVTSNASTAQSNGSGTAR
ncbi:MAG TPA: PilN domain-containing protein [Solirubrobacteraceae bacterium]|jgi:Tfp pilus assembly protein PilN